MARIVQFCRGAGRPSGLCRLNQYDHGKPIKWQEKYEPSYVRSLGFFLCFWSHDISPHLLLSTDTAQTHTIFNKKLNVVRKRSSGQNSIIAWSIAIRSASLTHIRPHPSLVIYLDLLRSSWDPIDWPRKLECWESTGLSTFFHIKGKRARIE
jgi:hypothetical protein